MRADEGPQPSYTVRAASCLHTATQSEVDEALGRITAPLDRAWRRLESACCVAIKANVVKEPERIRLTAGRRQELVDDAVLRSVLRLLRERVRARLILVDSTYHPVDSGTGMDVHFLPTLREFGVEYVECTGHSMRWYDVPGGGIMFGRYQLHECFGDVDEVVSIATLKSHAFMGVTLCTKNLFGLCPIHPLNRPRTYYHHIIRLPYVIADLGRLLDPCLNVIDGLVGQSIREWSGEARVCDALVAGDHCIATDACAAHIMGHDPSSDWPAPPFRRDRNHLRAAALAGFGTVNRNDVDFGHDLSRLPVGEFDSEATDASRVVASWRATTCQQALYYRDNRRRLLDRHAGEYIYLQDGDVVWHDAEAPGGTSRRKLSGARTDSALWLKYVDPDEREDERSGVYERELAAD